MQSSANQVSLADNGGDVSLAVHTNILSTNVQDIRQRILDTLAAVEQRNEQWKSLHLNLESAQMIDSTGLNFLVALVRHVKKRNVDIRITVASSNILKSFSFIRLDRQAQVTLVKAE